MERTLNESFHDAASALLYSLAEPHAGKRPLVSPFNDLTRFVVEQRARLPDYLRPPMLLATLLFDFAPLLFQGSRFHTLPASSRDREVERWKAARLGAMRDVVRYFESLGTYSLYTRLSQPLPVPGITQEPAWQRANAPASPRQSMNCEIAVIGSGPGGSITACLLAEAGRNVVLIEEGSLFPADAFPAFSAEEMVNLYRCGGQTVALGTNKVAYVEGRCVGGGSEINSGLYHRIPAEILDRWRREFGLRESLEADLRPHFEACETDLSVSLLPHAAPPASLKLHAGAEKLGWKSLEIPRWFKYSQGNPPERQSMMRTYIPRFLKAGGTLLPNTRAIRCRTGMSKWHVTARDRAGRPIEIHCEHLFLAGGAVQTPALLRRSGIERNIGNTLRVHPTIKVVAQFPEAVNSAQMGVPVHQVKEFAPHLSFGCSISTPPYLALGLLKRAASARLPEAWMYMANYYAMSAGESTGTVRTLPGFLDPLVRYRLRSEERALLSQGLRHLSRALFAAGAEKIYAGTEHGHVFSQESELDTLPARLENGAANLMTIHLFSSCPMGELPERTATNSFGRVHGFSNLYVNDASLLCTAPSVNPQGTIMAFARRNALHFLKSL